MNPRYNYSRRRSSQALAGNVTIGGDAPIRLQSMTNTSTLDTEGSAAQAMRIAEAGGEIVRLTTQGEREARNMAPIRALLREKGCGVPLVADVHFNPKAAFAAAEVTDKVRINPGNFVDPGRTFVKLEFTDEEYAAEIEKIRRTLVPFLEVCKAHGTCVRLGVNHGSLSDRIMSRYGDTPEGMVESVMEFLRVCEKENFHNIVISIKASNTTVMVRTVRLLVKEMEREGMSYPLHLGVTEAGDGEDGRVKSAVGIGTLLSEGIGDTIRVSLSEDPEVEIPVARRLRDYITAREDHSPVKEPEEIPSGESRLKAVRTSNIKEWPFVVGYDVAEVPSGWHHADAALDEPVPYGDTEPVVLTTSHVNIPGSVAAWIDRFVGAGGRNPVVVSLSYDDVDDIEELQVRAGADFGALLLNGYASGIEIRARHFDPATLHRLALGILQAARLRMTRTEYIACPSCGRTLFDLQKTLAEVREATSHLKGLKIGVMGCIVNGPGEMADADYGYVGAGPGRVSIYKGKTLVTKNIPAEEALPALLALIESDRQE
ncbi:MAG: (E)-4-hydroxy-3-methylbut-2-enyl-diphosphate synthase [Muribaculaceae bacterium]|nr:(E)-4-hydroxy-3-methylbut-2-enyl-diphosphate synthase [Muribaculaceae bacterium]